MSSTWQPSKIDLAISAVIAIAFPFLAGWLFILTGALLPMLLYYGLAWAIVMWRRGSSGYHRPSGIPRWFVVNIVVIVIGLILAYQAKIMDHDSSTIGILFGILIWAPLNASSEQLLWIYLFESYDCYPDQETNHFQYRLAGLLLFTAFVGLIHTMFWVLFLHTVNSSMTAGVVFVIITSISGYIHILVWRESNNMFYTFIPHLLLNIVPTIFTGYNMLPALINF